MPGESSCSSYLMVIMILMCELVELSFPIPHLTTIQRHQEPLNPLLFTSFSFSLVVSKSIRDLVKLSGTAA